MPVGSEVRAPEIFACSQILAIQERGRSLERTLLFPPAPVVAPHHRSLPEMHGWRSTGFSHETFDADSTTFTSLERAHVRTSSVQRALKPVTRREMGVPYRPFRFLSRRLIISRTVRILSNHGRIT